MAKPNDFQKQVHNALAGWHRNSESADSLFSGLQLVRQHLDSSANNQQLRYFTNKVLEDGMGLLATRNPQGAEVLQRRFRDNEIIKRVAISLHLSDDQINRRQREAIAQLSDIIWEQEETLRSKQAVTLENNLPPASYKQLFGLRSLKQTIVTKLLSDDEANIIAITGIGGIGKTSLADAVTRDVIGRFHFQQVLWLRIDPAKLAGDAITPQLIVDVLSLDLLQKLLPSLPEPLEREQRFQRIRQLLKQAPFLIVIDNVETDADTGMLLQYLSDWAGPSKFLITTRTRLVGQSTSLSYPLSEMSKADATILVAHHATGIGLADFAADAATVIDDIYTVTGGNPLAIKLVVNLVAIISLPHVLANLRKGGKADDIGELYRRIYRQAWLTLQHDVRELLQAMPLVGEAGGEVEQLEAISGLGNDAIWAAITDLVNRSLIEVRGDYHSRRYGVHRLTMTFLQTDIIGGDWAFT